MFSNEKGKKTVEKPAYRREQETDPGEGEQTAREGIGAQTEDLLKNAQDDDVQSEDHKAVLPGELQKRREPRW